MIKCISLLVCFVTSLALAQKPPTSAPESQAASVALVPDDQIKAVLSENSMTYTGKMALKVGAKPIEVALTERTSDKWTDEYINQRSQPDAKGRRIYVDSKRMKGTRNSDSGLVGVSIVYTFHAAETSIAIDNGRVMSTEVLNRLASQGGFFATDVTRTKSASVGSSVEIALEPMLHTFFDFDGKLYDVKSTLTLASIDTKNNKAIVTGPATWSEDTNVGPSILATGSFAADLSIEIDIPTRLISKVDLKGKMVASGRGNSAGVVSGEIKFEGKFTSQLIKDVKALTAGAPKFRDNTQQAHGTEFRLSSAWVEIKVDDPNMKKYVDSRVSSGDLYIEVNLRSEVMDLSNPASLTAFETSLKNTDPQAKAKKSSTPLGPAIAFELMAEARISVQGLIVSPTGKNLLMIRMIGPAAAADKALPEFRAMGASLKRG